MKITVLMAPIIYQDMRQNVHYDFPDKQLANDSYTHNLIKLLKTANLDKELNKDEYKDFKVSWLIITYTNTSKVVWSEAIRYYTDCIDFAVLLFNIRCSSSAWSSIFRRFKQRGFPL